MIIAVDFDETIAEQSVFFEIKEVPGALESLQAFRAAGASLVLWTNRSGPLLTTAVWFCELKGFEFDAVNESVWWWQRLWAHPKIYADLFIDDRNFGCPLIYRTDKRPIVDWEVVRPAVLQQIKGA